MKTKKYLLLTGLLTLFIISIVFGFIKQKTMSQLQKPLDPESKKIIENTVDEFLKDKVFDLVWKRTFHYITFFESLDGWSSSGSAGGSAVLTDQYVTVTTGATSGDTWTLKKEPFVTGLPTFSQKSYFRSAFVVPTSVQNETLYIVTGDLSGSYYGFKISGSTLYGVSSRSGTGSEQTITINSSIATGTTYNIEARYTPSSIIGEGKIIFFENSQEKGTLTDNTKLPSPASTVNTELITIKAITGANASKDLELSFVEYLQERNVLN